MYLELADSSRGFELIKAPGTVTHPHRILATKTGRSDTCQLHDSAKVSAAGGQTSSIALTTLIRAESTEQTTCMQLAPGFCRSAGP